MVLVLISIVIRVPGLSLDLSILALQPTTNRCPPDDLTRMRSPLMTYDTSPTLQAI